MNRKFWPFGRKLTPPPQVAPLPLILIDTYFNNSGAEDPDGAYLVVPRSILQRMGPVWQDSLVKLLTVMDTTLPDWRPEHPYSVSYRGPGGKLGQQDPAGAFTKGVQGAQGLAR